jgi:hypothetical protein
MLQGFLNHLLSNGRLVGTGRSAICVAYAGRFCLCFLELSIPYPAYRVSLNSIINSPFSGLTLLCVDVKTHSDYRKLMSNMTSQNGRNCLSRVQSLGFGLIYGALAALPLCGLVLFLEVTRPAQLHGAGFVSTNVASYSDGYRSSPVSLLRQNAVARLKGVSAELGRSTSQFSASDAALAFGGAPGASLKAGFKTEFVTKEHRRIAIRIVEREPITDRAVPDNSRLMDIVPASTANTVSFVWGSWLYTAEVQDKGVEPDVAVQEVL